MNIINSDILIINKNKNIILKNINKYDKFDFKLNNNDLITKAFDFFENNKCLSIYTKEIFWLFIKETILPSFFKCINNNISFKDNIITFNDKKYLSINDSFIDIDYNLFIDFKTIINEYLNCSHKKNINIIWTKYNIDNIKYNMTYIPNKIKYKIKYIHYKKDYIIDEKINPSLIHINYENFTKIKENIKSDIFRISFEQLYYYTEKKKYIEYFNDFNKIFYFTLKNIQKYGCITIALFCFLHENYLNYICYILTYFQKIIISSHNYSLTNYMSIYPSIQLNAINYNGKKIKKFNPKYNYNDNNSIKIKEELNIYINRIVDKFITDYINNKDIYKTSLEEIFLNNINNIKIYLLKLNIKQNLLLNKYFKKYDNNLLFDLNFFIKICINYNILNIYYLEYTEYVDYLINIMKPQYEKDFKYLKYEKKEKILNNDLLYLNTNDISLNSKILSKFNNIIIKSSLANFFEDFYIKDKNENYYFLNKNEFIGNYKSK